MQKKLLNFLILILIFSCTKLNKNPNQNLDLKMEKLGVDTVLIVSSQGIDEHILWSQDSNFIASNIEGKWYKFRLNNIELVEADYN